MTAFAKLSRVAGTVLRRDLPLPLFTALLPLLLAPFLFPVSCLGVKDSAAPMEMLVVLTGPALLSPAFLPEEDQSLRDILRLKGSALRLILFLRLLISCVFLLLLPAAFLLFLAANHSEISPMLWGNTAASALFLGGMGALSYSVCRNLAAAYMVPLLYYAMNFFAGARLKSFFLFSTVSTGTGFKLSQLVLGLMFLFLAAFLQIREK